MPSRNELKLRAAAVNVDESAYPNDSKLEMAVQYAEKHMTAKTNQTTKTPDSKAIAGESGAANV